MFFWLKIQKNVNNFNYNTKKIHIIDMQIEIASKYVAVILANGMRNQLHPLTMNFPFTNLPVGNKKLIVYQLQQLQSVADLSTIIVVYSEDSIKVKQYLQGQFIGKYPSYPHPIQFFQVENSISEYFSLQRLFSATTYEGFDEVKGVFIVPRNIVSSFKFSSLLAEHIDKQSDVSMLLKQKKEYGKDEKKPDFDYEPQVDIAMVGQKSQILAMISVENYDHEGLKLPASVYQRASRASFQKVIDMGLYIFSSRVVKIIKNLQNNEVCNLKTDFMDTLIKNQNNSTLLGYTNETEVRPLKITGKIAGQNDYIRSILNLNIYQSINLDSLIRGPKQKQPLMPTPFTQPIDEQCMSQFRGCLIGKGCEIEPGIKLTRNVIQNGCKIGKNVEMSNSIVMAGSIIEDGCKIMNCIIGTNCRIRTQSTLNSCQFATNCIVEKGSNIEHQMIIPTH